MKVEPVEKRCRFLQNEIQTYKLLAGSEVIPKVHWHGIEGDHNIMVMDLMGPSLVDLFSRACNRQLSLKIVLMLADQMISCIGYLHSRLAIEVYILNVFLSDPP